MSGDSQAPNQQSGTPTYLHKRLLVRSGTIENLNVQGQSSDSHGDPVRLPAGFLKRKRFSSPSASTHCYSQPR